jgi:hypothetical protein
MKVNFRVTGSLNIPESAVFHKDSQGQLYAVEFNNKMHMLQVCLVSESPDGEYEMLHQYDEMQANDILNKIPRPMGKCCPGSLSIKFSRIQHS